MTLTDEETKELTVLSDMDVDYMCADATMTHAIHNLKCSTEHLEKIDSDTARKIFDFLSGATYALNGNVQKVANNIFIFAPENVDIASTNDAAPKGFDFGSSQKDGWR